MLIEFVCFSFVQIRLDYARILVLIVKLGLVYFLQFHVIRLTNVCYFEDISAIELDLYQQLLIHH